MIHETAIVDTKTAIAKDVKIGPYSIIGADVEIGAGTWVGPHVVIKGPTSIGKSNKIFHFCSIGEDPQHLSYNGERTELKIGDNNIFREYCTINRGTKDGRGQTLIGDMNFFMSYVHVAHDCVIGSHTVFANCASLAGHVTVGDYTIFGGFSGIHQFCSVGPHVMTGIATISFKDIPPFLMVSGNTAKPYGLNVRGLKQRGFDEEAIGALKVAYKKIYRSGLPLQQALHGLKKLASSHKAVQQFCEFIASTERGIIR